MCASFVGPNNFGVRLGYHGGVVPMMTVMVMPMMSVVVMMSVIVMPMMSVIVMMMMVMGDGQSLVNHNFAYFP